jgi:hypothetical protein
MASRLVFLWFLLRFWFSTLITDLMSFDTRYIDYFAWLATLTPTADFISPYIRMQLMHTRAPRRRHAQEMPPLDILFHFDIDKHTLPPQHFDFASRIECLISICFSITKYWRTLGRSQKFPLFIASTCTPILLLATSLARFYFQSHKHFRETASDCPNCL